MAKYKVWDIKDIRLVLNEVSEKMGLDCSNIPVFINKRLKTCKGKFIKDIQVVNGKKKFSNMRFQIAANLLTGNYKEENVREVIIHEYIHYYTDVTENESCYHDHRFKYNCRKAGISDSTYLTFDVNKSDYKYTITCLDCNKKFNKNRLKGGIEYYTKNFICKTCKGSLSVTKHY